MKNWRRCERRMGTGNRRRENGTPHKEIILTLYTVANAPCNLHPPTLQPCNHIPFDRLKF